MLNYKHLHYFQQVAEAGSMTRASERLHVSPQTISTQIAELEDRLGVELFVKHGRKLELTDIGRLTLQYARDIFTTGAELEAVLRDRSGRGKALEFRVGVADSMSKAVAFHLVEPALELPDPVRLICQEGRAERLLAELAMHRLDLVLSDAPVPASVSVQAYSHRLGATEVAFYAAAGLRERFAGEFPGCLDGAPVLLPGADAAIGQRLRAWLDRNGVRPVVVGEFDDSALAQEFGKKGVGFFVGPAFLAPSITAQHGMLAVGLAQGVRDEFYALSIERRITHRCVVAITEAARSMLI